jgi:2-phosphosulfolactate phosphatase
LIDVTLVPAEIPENHQLAGQAVLVIDVLRATSTIVTALIAGATSVVPVMDPVEARKLAAVLGDSILLGGEKEGLPLPGFDLGNSPLEYVSEKVGGRVVVLSTTNGTVALRRVQTAEKVGTAAFLNAAAAADWSVRALNEGLKLMLVCAGTVRRFSWEDTCLAGLLTCMVQERMEGVVCSDGAIAASRLWKGFSDPYEVFMTSRHGKRLMELGFDADLTYCAQVSAITAVPELHNARLTLEERVS